MAAWFRMFGVDGPVVSEAAQRAGRVLQLVHTGRRSRRNAPASAGRVVPRAEIAIERRRHPVAGRKIVVALQRQHRLLEVRAARRRASGYCCSIVSNSGSVIGASSRIFVATGLQRLRGTMLPGKRSRTQVLPTCRAVVGIVNRAIPNRSALPRRCRRLVPGLRHGGECRVEQAREIALLEIRHRQRPERRRGCSCGLGFAPGCGRRTSCSFRCRSWAASRVRRPSSRSCCVLIGWRLMPAALLLQPLARKRVVLHVPVAAAVQPVGAALGGEVRHRRLPPPYCALTMPVCSLNSLIDSADGLNSLFEPPCRSMRPSAMPSIRISCE